MKKIDNLTNKYPLSKTLRFRLIPVGKTMEHFTANRCLEVDEQRAEDYKAAKKIMDRRHRAFIEQVLQGLSLRGVEEYAELYYSSEKSDSDRKRMYSLADDLRSQIAVAFTRHADFTALRPYDMVSDGLTDYVDGDSEADIIENFRGFTSYFTGFHENRQNLYSAEDKHTSVAARCISENLPRFLDNAKNFKQIYDALPAENIAALSKNFMSLCSSDISVFFKPENFSFFLSQQQIDKYNTLIGGYTMEDGTKIQGINEYVNMHNQICDRSARLPLLVPLYQQLLGDHTTASFVADQFTTDAELLYALNGLFNAEGEGGMDLYKTLHTLQDLMTALSQQDVSRIYMKSGAAVSDLSLALCGDRAAIADAWNSTYDGQNMQKKPKNMTKYLAARNAAYKKVKSYSLSDLQALCNRATERKADVLNYICSHFAEAKASVNIMYTAAAGVLNRPAGNSKALMQDTDAVARIKDLLDSIKAVSHVVLPLLGSGLETDRDELFYSQFIPCCDVLTEVNRLYDRVRNYLTQKPYSDEKIKLNFGNPSFLGGWSAGFEKQYSSCLFRSGNDIFLGVMDKGHKSAFGDFPAPKNAEDMFEKMEYRQMASPSKDIPCLMVIDGVTVRRVGKKEKTGPHAGENLLLEDLKNTHLPPEINRIRKARSFSINSENFSKADLTAYIDYYKARVSEYNSAFTFTFKPSEEYANFAEFTDHVDSQAYQVKFVPVSKQHIDLLVDTGALYLFRLYNKDFSADSKGRPNLHTLYFRMLFDERNLKDIHYQLCGGAEMFYRKASISDENKILHPANQAVKNKNPLNKKGESTFTYDLVKDRRYTEDQLFLHLPVALNGNSEGKKNINLDVRETLREAGGTNVIGISRGEHDLLYICVIDRFGEVLEQESLNIVDSGTAETPNKHDYKALLTRLDEEKRDAQRAWQSAKNSKEIKTGYLSQVVNKVCNLVVKYDAVIAMEDMNHGKNKGAYQLQNDVYKAFEKMLIDKLNFFVLKGADIDAPGGLLNAYQLTNKFESFQKLGRQNGIIFYVSPGMTNNLDPVTGFIDFLRPRYTTEAAASEFFSFFDSIYYNAEENHFEFSFNYDMFPSGELSSRKAWKVCTKGTRINSYRNRYNNTVVHEELDITKEMKKLFKEYGIDYTAGNLVDAIVKQGGKDFYMKLMRLLALTLQMRNQSDTDSYFISPVRSFDGVPYDSRRFPADAILPCAADGVTAYNMARKALLAVQMIFEAPAETLAKTNLFLSYEDWLRYAQANWN